MYTDFPGEQIQEGTIFVVRAKRGGLDYLPVFPARREDDALMIADGIMLNCLGLKEIQPGAFLYEMEIVTGPKSGDIVYVAHKLISFLEVVPSKKRIR